MSVIYRIETGRLVIRCWEPADAAKLKRAVDLSIPHLHPWLPWAKFEPQTIEEKVEMLRGFRSKFDRDEDYVLGIFDRKEGEVVGGTGYHLRRGENEREIGYWVRADRKGEGIITEATAALTCAGFELNGLSLIEIRCDPENHASAAIPRKLGFVHEGTLRQRRLPMSDSLRDVMIWSMTREQFWQERPCQIDYRAFDVLGEPIEPKSSFSDSAV